MNARALVLFLWGCLVASAAVAGEEHKSEIKIAIESDGDEPRVFEWHSSDPDSDLSNLAVGESKILTGDDGEDVTVTRTEEGLTFDVGGEKVEVFELAGDGEHNVIVDATKKIKVMKTGDTDGVTIISNDALDDQTRAKIEAALKDAGKEGKVLFLDGSELNGEEQVHGEHKVIIRKEVEKTTD